MESIFLFGLQIYLHYNQKDLDFKELILHFQMKKKKKIQKIMISSTF